MATQKTRDDVSALFDTVLNNTTHKFTAKDKPSLSEFVDFLDSFGSDLAYAVLWEYLYVRPTNFYDRVRIIDILKENLASEYPQTETALADLKKLILSRGFYNPPPPDQINPLLAEFLNENGGWVKLCQTEVDKLDKLFTKAYPEIIAKKVEAQLRARR